MAGKSAAESVASVVKVADGATLPFAPKTGAANAAEFLEFALSACPVEVATLIAAAAARGIPLTKLRRARERLGVVVQKRGPGWIWSLPPRPARAARAASHTPTSPQTCLSCGETKPETDFPLNPVWRPGRPKYHPKCFDCPAGVVIVGGGEVVSRAYTGSPFPALATA